MDDHQADAATPAAGGADAATPAADSKPLLPARLSPFAPPDPAAERRTTERLARMSPSQLGSRRDRIDRRLFELGLAIGEAALAIPSVRGTGLVDLDRILRKVDALDHARDQAKLEREADGGKLAFGLGWLQDAFRSRELRARRVLLVSELGLALCAVDQRVVEEYAPHVKRLLDLHVTTARRIDELFVEMRLVDDEVERRVGQEDPPKEIDQLLLRARDSVDEVSSRVGDTLAELGRTAARGAARTSGQAVLGLARGAALGAWTLGARAADRLVEAADDDGEADPEPRARSAPRAAAAADESSAPRSGEIPALIRQLAQLRDEGILSDAEFAAKKAELLTRL